MLEEKQFQQRMQQIEGLIRNIENLPDATARTSALELVQTLMEFHGAGLERLMEIVADAGDPGYRIFEDFARDHLVGSVLLLYGLHPHSLVERVTRALDKVRPYLDSHGGNVELLGVSDEGAVRLRMEGSCKSCPSSSMTLKLAIEEAIYEVAPDVTSIEAEGVAEQPKATGFVQIGKSPSNGNGAVQSPPPADGSGNGWEDVRSLAAAAVQSLEIRGQSVLFCRLGEALYAYADNCPGCAQPLGNARLESTSLVCPNCGQHYDVIRAGRGLDQPNLHLVPFPLLIEHGQARVAIPY